MSDEYVPVCVDDSPSNEVYEVPPCLKDDVFENLTAPKVCHDFSKECMPDTSLPRDFRPQKLLPVFINENPPKAVSGVSTPFKDESMEHHTAPNVNRDFSKEYMPETSLPRTFRSQRMLLSQAQINAAFEDPWSHLSSVKNE